MTRNARALLKDLARHRRDEEAVAMRRLANLLVELTRQASGLRAEIERAEMAARQRVADPFERDLAEAYVGGLREKLVEVEAAREEMSHELTTSRKSLERRVIEHRQMDGLHAAAEQDRIGEATRREEIRHDDVAAGSWHRGRGEERGR